MKMTATLILADFALSQQNGRYLCLFTASAAVKCYNSYMLCNLLDFCWIGKPQRVSCMTII